VGKSIVLFLETPCKCITAKLSICKPGSSSVLRRFILLFDVVSLFTNVPVEEACNIAKDFFQILHYLKELIFLLRMFMIC
jgi:hypothetical protein